MTLTFNLLLSKYKQFIFVSNCTVVANLVKFPKAVYGYRIHKPLVYNHGHANADTVQQLTFLSHPVYQ